MNFQKPYEHRLVVSLIVLVYVAIIFFSLDFPYFWDNIQYSSRTSHWYFENNFSSIVLPFFTEELIVVGGGSISFIGLSTAALWKIFGQHLWVSHVYVGLWALLMIYHSVKLCKELLPKDYTHLAIAVLLLESAIMAQLVMASIDIVLVSLCVMALRFTINKRYFWLMVTTFILAILSSRGFIAVISIGLFSIVYHYNAGQGLKNGMILLKHLWPFVPGVLIYAFFFFYKQSHVSEVESPWVETMRTPDSFLWVLKNTAAYGLRLLENGRFAIWLLFSFSLLWVFKRQHPIIKDRLFLALMGSFFFLFVVYFYFAITTAMLIATRYYMVIMFIVVLILFKLLPLIFDLRMTRIITVVIIVFQLTGHFWVYPKNISQSWDATMAHIPFYELREKTISYLKDNDYDFSEVGGGFSFNGNQRYIDLKDRDLVIANSFDMKYYVYSNIYNLTNDRIDQLYNREHWREIKTFRKGMVFVTIFEKQEDNIIE